MALRQAHDSLVLVDTRFLLAAQNAPTCLICYEPMLATQALRYTPCVHLYHLSCIYNHIVGSTIGAQWDEPLERWQSPAWSMCPTCRTPIAFLDVALHPANAAAFIDLHGRCVVACNAELGTPSAAPAAPTSGATQGSDALAAMQASLQGVQEF